MEPGLKKKVNTPINQEHVEEERKTKAEQPRLRSVVIVRGHP